MKKCRPRMSLRMYSPLAFVPYINVTKNIKTLRMSRFLVTKGIFRI